MAAKAQIKEILERLDRIEAQLNEVGVANVGKVSNKGAAKKATDSDAKPKFTGYNGILTADYISDPDQIRSRFPKKTIAAMKKDKAVASKKDGEDRLRAEIRFLCKPANMNKELKAEYQKRFQEFKKNQSKQEEQDKSESQSAASESDDAPPAKKAPAKKGAAKAPAKADDSDEDDSSSSKVSGDTNSGAAAKEDDSSSADSSDGSEAKEDSSTESEVEPPKKGKGKK